MIFLVCADIHGNREAFRAILKAEKNYDTLLVLGDVVSYGADSVYCIKQLIKNKKSLVLSGNHDAAVADKLDLNWFSPHARFSIEKTKKMLSPPHIQYLADLPHTVAITDTLIAVHGSPIEPLTGYMWGGDETSQVFDYMTQKGIQSCFASHTHQPSAFFYTKNILESFFPVPEESFCLNDYELCICNPGSAGFPRFFNGIERMMPTIADITEKSFPASYFLWNSTTNLVTFKEIRYNVTATERKILKRMEV